MKLCSAVPLVLLALAGARVAAAAASATSAASTDSTDFQRRCEALSSRLKLENVTVNIVQFVANGAGVELPDNPPTCQQTSQATAGPLCRVAMAVNTSPSSQITLEAWLPQNFSGRFLSTGNRGIEGCIVYSDVAYGAGLGFATVGANDGHNGTSGLPFLHHPEVITDYAWRSVHTGVVVGKQVTDALYGAGARHNSYYLGCSSGGREGVKSAEMFPDDFDGIVAGAPAIAFTELFAWELFLNRATGFDNTSADFVPLPLWSLINDEVLRQCDGLDGAVDGIIEDPDLCAPDLTGLLCASSAGSSSSGGGSACLSGAQLRRAQLIYTPLYGPDGQLWYPRMQPGSETDTAPYYYAGVPSPGPTDWFRYVVYNDSSFDPTKVTQADFAAMIAQNPSDVDTFPASLEPFRRSGGKLLTFHGMQDFLISSDNSARYYRHLAAGMGLPPTELDAFYRYFRISGMGHCLTGPGAWSIGQGQVQIDGVVGDPAALNPTENVLLAVVDWVEQGVAPEYVRGTKYVNDNVTAGVEFRRKHCKYPARNVYVGPGNYTDENAWQCIRYQGQELIKQLPTGDV